MDFADYLKMVDSRLGPYYTPPKTTVGHDWEHVFGMLSIGKKITYLSFDPQEFEIAVRLHNLDRSKALMASCAPEDREEGVRSLVAHFLEQAPFDEPACERITDAALRHHKKDVEPGDSPLLTALMDADKLVRFTPLSIPEGGAYAELLGIPIFLRERPFGFGPTGERSRKSLWIALMAVLEWVGMLSCDAARELINPRYLRHFIEHIRLLGEDIAERTGVENTAEDDIEKALGAYYRWALVRAGLA